MVQIHSSPPELLHSLKTPEKSLGLAIDLGRFSRPFEGQSKRPDLSWPTAQRRRSCGFPSRDGVFDKACSCSGKRKSKRLWVVLLRPRFESSFVNSPVATAIKPDKALSQAIQGTQQGPSWRCQQL